MRVSCPPQTTRRSPNSREDLRPGRAWKQGLPRAELTTSSRGRWLGRWLGRKPRVWGPWGGDAATHRAQSRRDGGSRRPRQHRTSASPCFVTTDPGGPCGPPGAAVTDEAPGSQGLSRPTLSPPETSDMRARHMHITEAAAPVRAGIAPGQVTDKVSGGVHTGKGPRPSGSGRQAGLQPQGLGDPWGHWAQMMCWCS